jgi:hypothetical protein
MVQHSWSPPEIDLLTNAADSAFLLFLGGSGVRGDEVGGAVSDLLDESSFDASPAHAIPGPVGKAAAKAADKLKPGN